MVHPFRAAVEARDHDAMIATLAPDVQFHSPVAFRPFDGREATAGVLEAILSVFEDFEYTDELASGDTVALLFRARVETSRCRASTSSGSTATAGSRSSR